MTSLGAAALLVAFGIPNLAWPHRMALLGEQLDAIGSDRPRGDVEPTSRNVTFTRLFGGAFLVFAAVVALGG
jgi:hypothetical protein